MKTSLFDFHLPQELIAQQALTPRDAARMLVMDGGRLEDKNIRELPDHLRQGDVMVFNNSKVIPARLYGLRDHTRIECLLHKPASDSTWQVFAKPAKKLRAGDVIAFIPLKEHAPHALHATVEDKLPSGEILLNFNCTQSVLLRQLEHYGDMPLPPYITRANKAHEEDKSRYQTIYATHNGSVAAPTAGLHFTQQLFEALNARGIKTAFVTLHVGAGTFQPVKVEDITTHAMHSEWAEISEESAALINNARSEGGRVIAVGTTSLRTLETAAKADGTLTAFQGETAIFISPGYRFKLVDRLVTNFHLPKSTLFMLVSAFCGLENAHKAYAHAIEQCYRFYSYGDACFIHRQL